MDLGNQSEHGRRNLAALKIVAGLVAVGAAIGLFTGLLSATALRAIGLKPTDSPVVSTAQKKPTPATPKPSAAPSSTQPSTSLKPPRTVQLDARPHKVSPGQRISLTGQVPGLGPDQVLQVQRKSGSGGWQDFPVTVRTSAGGDFSTWVQTSRVGPTKFRLIGKGTDVRTPTVTVEIG